LRKPNKIESGKKGRPHAGTKIKSLEMELADKERELSSFRQELGTINVQLEKFINQFLKN